MMFVSPTRDKTRFCTGMGLFVTTMVLWMVLWSALGHADPGTSERRELVSRYLRAVYAQNYTEAYRYSSRRDRQIKSEATYLRENPSLTRGAAKLAHRLAERSRIGPLSSEIRGDSATVRFTIILPDANSAELQKLFAGFDPDILNRLTQQQRQQIHASVDELVRNDRLPTITGQESLELLRENGRWTIFQNWEAAVKVFFHAKV